MFLKSAKYFGPEASPDSSIRVTLVVCVVKRTEKSKSTVYAKFGEGEE